ncbi:hypothetical protein BD410DRAFT_808038 [Rickenella mellea]|uniref:Uncharacterized protein n=1 Tax=Rickenella mellea TaxID=50990 RepID=A0A4Y7PN20_9AGAM|nr:hypothetical protein BD410DRAFT_808038 [Rickenella mellea]
MRALIFGLIAIMFPLHPFSLQGRIFYLGKIRANPDLDKLFFRVYVSFKLRMAPAGHGENRRYSTIIFTPMVKTKDLAWRVIPVAVKPDPRNTISLAVCDCSPVLPTTQEGKYWRQMANWTEINGPPECLGNLRQIDIAQNLLNTIKHYCTEAIKHGSLSDIKFEPQGNDTELLSLQSSLRESKGIMEGKRRDILISQVIDTAEHLKDKWEGEVNERIYMHIRDIYHRCVVCMAFIDSQNAERRVGVTNKTHLKVIYPRCQEKYVRLDRKALDKMSNFLDELNEILNVIGVLYPNTK